MHDFPSAPFVLIVEDEWLVRDELAAELRQAGWTVLESSSGESAIAYLHSGEPISAVITDIQLGGTLNGWDVADAFRAVNPHVPVIYVSGNMSETSRMVAGSLFFTKPYVTVELAEACRKLGHPDVPYL